MPGLGRRRPLLGLALGVAMISAGSAIAAPRQASPAGTAPAARVDFATQGFDVQRTGFNPSETVLSTSTVAGLHELWTFDLGTITNVQPVYAVSVNVEGHRTDVVYIGAKDGNFYALDALTGAVIWQQFTGVADTDGCGGPYGEDGTPVLDRAMNRIYVPGGDGMIYAFDLSTGAAVSGWPVVVITNTLHEHIYSGLTLWQGRLYVAIASYCDQPPYEGRVTLVDTVSPTRGRIWLVTGPGPPSGGGIWAPGGVSIDPADQNVYTATGNALTQANFLYAEHVVRLTPNLSVVSSNYPGLQQGADLDFGSTPVLYQAAGCPPQLAVKNKDGELFVYDRDTIDDGPTQAIIMSTSIGVFQGDVAYVGRRVFVPNGMDSVDGTYQHGVVAFTVQADCTLALAWQQPIGLNGDYTPSPTVANGVVYYPAGSTGQLYALEAATGAILWDSGTAIAGPMYQSATVVNGRVFVASYDEKLHAFGL